MKKSNLRKIIRESIKELMNEQTNYPCYGCVGGAVEQHPNMGAGQPGDCGYNSTWGQMNTDPTVVEASCQNVGPVTNTQPKTYGCCLPAAINYNSTISGQGCENCSCVIAGPGGPNDVAGFITGNDIQSNNNSCGVSPNAYSGPTTSSTCDGSLWANQSMWENNFSNIVSNHNNPCAFLQSRMDTWMQNIGNVGPNQANMLVCKIKYIQTVLWPQYNC
tara:strand:- start:153 stop:806 length:654 start_codon:yes stop_codon:yes gene_type:complete